MKPILTIILSLSFTLTTIGQKPQYPDSGFTNKTEAKNLTINGKKEGKWIEYLFNDSGHKDTANCMLMVYRHGKIEGIFRQYFKNGNLKMIVHYKNGLENGIGKFYWESGKLWEESFFKEGDAISTKVFDKNGNEIKK